MSCFDVYVLPSGCNIIQTYPSDRHPNPGNTGGGGVRPGLKPWINPREPDRKRVHIDTDEDILAALGLFGPRL